MSKSKLVRSAGNALLSLLSGIDRFSRPLDFVQVTSGPFDDRNPSLLRLSNERFILAFDSANRLDRNSVFATFSNDYGRVWSTPVKIAEGFYPSLVFHEGSIFLVYASLLEGGSQMIMGQRSRDGESWSPPQILVNVNKRSKNPRVSAANGAFCLCFDSGYSDGRYGIEHGGQWSSWFASSSDFNHWSAPTKVSEITEFTQYPSIAYWKSKILLAYHMCDRSGRSRSIYLQSSSDIGRSWSSPIQVGKAWFPRDLNPSRLYPHLAVNDRGLTVAFYAEEFGGKICASSSKVAERWSRIKRVTSGPGVDRYAHLCPLDKGEHMLSWSTNRYGNWNIVCAKIKP